MPLDLDPRQRAMLREMGLRVWTPHPLAARSSARAQGSPEPASRKLAVFDGTVGTPPKTPAPSLHRLANLAELSWSGLHHALVQCQDCKQANGRRTPVFTPVEPGPVDWLVLSEPPDETEERSGKAVAGQAGLLLDNMLRAVGAARADGGGAIETDKVVRWRAYVSNVVKCRPAVLRNPDASDLARCEAYLRREVALLQPRVILAMGRLAAQALLQGDPPGVAHIPLGKLRGQVYRYQGVAVVVSYPASYLLRTPQHKARAWLDLCLAVQQLGPSQD